MIVAPTGTQYRISAGACTAVIAEVGATLRSLQVQGRELLWAYGDDVTPVPWNGTTLAPWPNRIRDGRFTFDGADYAAPLNEPALHNALHGLVHNHEWRLRARTEDSLTLTTTVYPQLGWGWVLSLEQTFRVDDQGLIVSFRATNTGGQDLPFGYGAHPYFAFDDIDEVVMSAPFSQMVLTDERLLPVEIAEVDPAHDFRESSAIGLRALDTAFTGGPRRWEVRLAGPVHAVTVWADERFPMMQCYTHPNRRAIAVEPMTCGPDAFNPGPTHGALIRLSAGQCVGGDWGVRSG